MNHLELLESCAAYALGALDALESQALERHLADGCPECASELASMREATGALALAAPPARPTVRLKRRLLSRVGDDAFYFVRTSERDWEAPSAGARVARLFIDPWSERESVVIELDAGASVTGSGLALDTVFVIGGSLPGATAGPEGARLLAIGARNAGAGIESGGAATPHTRVGAATFAIDTATAATPVSPRIVSLASDSPPNWRDLGSGCFVRPLGIVDARAANIIRVDAGGAFPEHDHGRTEESYVLSGDCVCEGETLGAGDYHRAPAGSHHAPTHTHRGCSAIVVG